MGITRGDPDLFGGQVQEISQWHWGHRAEKRTWLYWVGCRPFGWSFVAERQRPLEDLSHRQRLATPIELATWLCLSVTSNPPQTPHTQTR